MLAHLTLGLHMLFIHPNIKSFFTVKTFEYFDPDSELFKRFKYTSSKFKLIRISFDEGFKSGIIKSVTRFLANKKPLFYESYKPIYFS